MISVQSSSANKTGHHDNWNIIDTPNQPCGVTQSSYVILINETIMRTTRIYIIWYYLYFENLLKLNMAFPLS
jgi:hypothetical protein